MMPENLEGCPVVIGAGIAGLMTALHLSPQPVVLLTKSRLGAQSSSELAQGGVAAALGPDDSPALHLADTLAAGDGLCDEQVARHVTEAAPSAIETLSRLGVRFDRRADGSVRLGLEAAHSRNRIVHAGGDGTGREIVDALVGAVRATPSITIMEHMEARRLLVAEGAICGVLAEGPDGAVALETVRVVIATGGIGGLFDDSTNPMGSWGQGLMLAASAGAELADLEFIQFHPTALDRPARPMRLLSEAVRGEGAELIDETGRRFLEGVPGAELAPRDVVTRAVAAHLAKGHRVFLDARQSLGAAFPSRFPTVTAFCLEAGIDPARDLIPIRPAAHYHMGGIAVDGEGRSTIRGLWACGEAACTGLHGANRLASNSLIEAAVFARKVAQSVSAAPADVPHAPIVAEAPPRPDPAAVRAIVSRTLGVVRSGHGLRDAIAALLPMVQTDDAAALGLMMAVAALRREESRGGHFRVDHPCKAPAARHSRLTFASALAAARYLSTGPVLMARSAYPMSISPLPAIMLEPLVRATLLEDLGRAGDITTDAIVPVDHRETMALRARQPGVVAGLDLAALAFRLIDPAIGMAVERQDGSIIEAGDVIATVSGPARGLLTAERTALNFLCLLSGIASATHAVVTAVSGHGARIVCTRKTTPCLRAIEKYAVRVGGGSNHRFGLDDAVLVKDNHIAIAGGVRPAIERVHASCGHMVKIEVEVDALAQLEEALAIGVDAVLLDNMSLETLGQAVALVNHRAITEASGSVTPDTAPAIAGTGIDLISIGWLTHSAPILDIGLDHDGKAG